MAWPALTSWVTPAAVFTTITSKITAVSVQSPVASVRIAAMMTRDDQRVPELAGDHLPQAYRPGARQGVRPVAHEPLSRLRGGQAAGGTVELSH
jgi:hypothetical protein